MQELLGQLKEKRERGGKWPEMKRHQAVEQDGFEDTLQQRVSPLRI